MALSSSQVRYLRSLAHDLSPVILLGNKGASDAVVKELGLALNQHELVKVKLSGGDKEEREAQIETLSVGTEAEIIHKIGHVVVLFRRNIDEPKIAPAALMDLSLDQTDGYLLVRRVGAHSITLLDRELSCSFLLAPDQAIENWTVDAASQLGADHVEALLALQPELVILGTGLRQTFPSAAFMAGFLRRNIGIEVMDNAAAARTYNLLAGEGRRVIAGFILPTPSLPSS